MDDDNHEGDTDDAENEQGNALVGNKRARRQRSAEASAGCAGELDENDDEQPCDLRLQRSLKIMSIAFHQAVAAAGVESTSTDAAAATAAAAMAVMIGGPSAASSGMPLHSTAAVTPAASHLHHPHHPLLSFSHVHAPPPPRPGSPTRAFGVCLVPPTGIDVVSPSGSGTGTSTAPGSGTGIVPSVSITATTSSNASTSTAAGLTGGNGGSGSSGGGAGGGGSGGGSGGSSWGGAYTCERCGNSYARPHSLNRHVRFECGVEPKFECPICHKKSKHKHNLVLHMRTHQHR